MSMKENWMSAFQPQTPNPLFDKPLVYNPGSEFGTAAGEHRIGRLPCLNHQVGLARVVSLGFNYAILSGVNEVAFGDVQNIATKAHSYGLGIVAKNPKRIIRPDAFVAHPNVCGVIVEQGFGGPAEHESWRKRASKEGVIPVWFVFDDQAAAQQCVAQIQQGHYRGMGVVAASDQGQIDRQLLLPIV